MLKSKSPCVGFVVAVGFLHCAWTERSTVFWAAPGEHKRNCSAGNEAWFAFQMRGMGVMALRWPLTLPGNLLEAPLQCHAEWFRWRGIRKCLFLIERSSANLVGINAARTDVHPSPVSAVWIICLFKWLVSSVLCDKVALLMAPWVCVWDKVASVPLASGQSKRTDLIGIHFAIWSLKFPLWHYF